MNGFVRKDYFCSPIMSLLGYATSKYSYATEWNGGFSLCKSDCWEELSSGYKHIG
jgi:hypothetical protein